MLWDDGRADGFLADTDCRHPAALACGLATGNAPDREPEDAWCGEDIGSFLEDYYNRILIEPQRIDFGNIASPTTAPVCVWNAYFTATTLTGLAGDTAGLDLAFAPPPRTLRGLAQVCYDVTATLDGPSVVDTLLALTFSQGGTHTLAVRYNAALVAPFAIDWQGGFLERLEWLTDVLARRDGGEQRVRLRDLPRRFFEYAVLEHGAAAAATLDRLRGTWQARSFVVPVWPHKALLGDDLQAGALAIAVDTLERDYYAGGLAVLGDAQGHSEVVALAAVAAGALTLKRGVRAPWPAGSWIAPGRDARLRERQLVSRPTAQITQGRLVWECLDLTAPLPALSEATYAGYPVLTRAPDRSEDLVVEYWRLIERTDNQIAAPRVVDLAGQPMMGRTLTFLAASRGDIAALRAWLYARAGRLAPCWVPTWEAVITLAADVEAGDTERAVRHQGFSTSYAEGAWRRDVGFLHRGGTWTFRHVTWVYAGGVVETMVLDTALGRACARTDFRLICFLELMRLEGDTLEVAYETDAVARVAVTLRGLPAPAEE